MMAAAKHVVLFPFPGQGHLSAFMSLADLLHGTLPNAAITLVSTPHNVAALRTTAWSNSSFLGFHALPFTPADHGLPPDCESSDAVQPGAIAGLLVAFESLEAAFDDYLSAAVAAAVEAQTGRVPELSTTGGTSDARFLSRLCPTVEFGLLNSTMHKVDEAVAIDDLRMLTAIYADLIRRAAA